MKKLAFSFLMALILTSSPVFADVSLKNGKSLVSNFISNKHGKLFLYGIATEEPFLMFAFSEEGIWQNLSKDEQKSICVYIKWITDKAAFYPTPYIDVPESAPFYEQARLNAKLLCPSCWEVSGPENTYVFGDGIWERRSHLAGQKDLRFSSVFKPW